jgi:hypothetical protein
MPHWLPLVVTCGFALNTVVGVGRVMIIHCLRWFESPLAMPVSIWIAFYGQCDLRAMVNVDLLLMSRKMMTVISHCLLSLLFKT